MFGPLREPFAVLCPVLLVVASAASGAQPRDPARALSLTAVLEASNDQVEETTTRLRVGRKEILAFEVVDASRGTGSEQDLRIRFRAPDTPKNRARARVGFTIELLRAQGTVWRTSGLFEMGECLQHSPNLGWRPCGDWQPPPWLEAALNIDKTPEFGVDYEAGDWLVITLRPRRFSRLALGESYSLYADLTSRLDGATPVATGSDGSLQRPSHAGPSPPRWVPAGTKRRLTRVAGSAVSLSTHCNEQEPLPVPKPIAPPAFLFAKSSGERQARLEFGTFSRTRHGGDVTFRIARPDGTVERIELAGKRRKLGVRLHAGPIEQPEGAIVSAEAELDVDAVSDSNANCCLGAALALEEVILGDSADGPGQDLSAVGLDPGCADPI